MVYDNAVKEIIGSSMSGFNSTIFAYGQTSSGKTHTMYGSDLEPGIINLAVKSMFEKVKGDTQREYLIRVSFLEIYNEVLRDLLEPAKTNLKIHENAKREIFVGDLSEHIVFNAEQVEEVMQKGDRNRHIAGTNMNERSSRSHTIFRIVVESREKADHNTAAGSSEDASDTYSPPLTRQREKRLSTSSDATATADSGEFTGAVIVSCLNLVDLAGSERVGQTGAEGQRLKEGAHINKSLLSLGTVIARLSEDGGDRGHIPYRDSRLTRILQPSLGGNAKTLIICTITPSSDYIDEALSTLKFASRAKTIQNKPEINEELRGDALLRRLKRASELEKEVVQMREIERKKVKIEAHNESLLRQLWKSQKESERLKRELEMQQSNVFISSNGIGNGAASGGAAAGEDTQTIRRQTWFPGFSHPVASSNVADNKSDRVEDDSGVGSSDAMDTVDEDKDNAPATTTSRRSPRRSSASINNNDNRTEELYSLAVDKINELEQKADSLQQQKNELASSNLDMEKTVQKHIRNYDLVLTTLKQLASADAIPPSPAKKKSAHPASPPKELVQIRRRLRALLTTIDASQKQCKKIQLQRPEAEFLEMELRAVRETLLEKEAELSTYMRESGETLAKLEQTELSLGSANQNYQELLKQLEILDASKTEASKVHNAVVSQLEAERQTVVTQKQEMDTLQTEYAANEQRQQQQQQALDSANKVAESLSQTIDGLNTQLAEAKNEVTTLQTERKSLDDVRSEKQAQIDEISKESDQMREQIDSQLSSITGLEHQLKQKANSLQELTQLAEQRLHLIGELKSETTTYSERLKQTEDTHTADMAHLKDQIEAKNKTMASEKKQLETNVNELQAELSKVTEELKSAKEQLEQRESSMAQGEEKTTATISALREESAQHQKELASTQEERTQLLHRISVKQTEIDAATAACTLAQERMDKLESQNADVWDRVSELTVANNDMETKLTEAQKSADDERQNLQHTITTKSEEVSQLALTNQVLEAKLTDSLKTIDEERQSWEKTAETKKEEIAKLRQEVEQLKAELEESDKGGTEANSMVGKLNHKIRDLNEELTHAKTQLSESEAALGAMREDHTKFQSDIANLQSDKETKKAEWDSLLASKDGCLEQQGKELREANLQLTRTQERENEASKHIDELEDQLESVRAELESTKEDMSKHDLGKSELEKEHAELTAKLDTTEKTKKDLETQVDELRAEIDSLTSLDKKQQKLVEELKDKFVQSNNLLGEAEEARSKLAADLTAQKELSAQHEATIEEEKKRMADIDESHKMAVSELESQVSSLATERDELATKMEAVETELTEVTTKLSKSETNIMSLKEDHKCLSIKHTEATEMITVLKEKAEELSSPERTRPLEMEIKELRQLADTRSEEVKDLTQKLHEVQADNTRSLSSRVSLVAERDQLQKELNELETRYKQSQGEIDETVSSLKNELNSKVIDIEGLESALEDANVALAAAKSEAQEKAVSRIVELETQVSDLENQITESQAANDSLREEAAAAGRKGETSLAQSKTTIEELEAERDRAREDIDTLKGMMTKLAEVKNGELAELEEKAAELGSLLNDSVQESKVKDKTIKECEKKAKHHGERVKQMEEDLEAALAQSTEDIGRMEKERNEIQAELKEYRAKVKKDEKKALDKTETAIKQAQAEARASIVSAFLPIASKLSELPGCQGIDFATSLESVESESSYIGLIERVEQLVTVVATASASDKETATADLTQIESEMAELKKANNKLEKNNTKLRDMYKADVTQLHGEEEKQRQRADGLVQELANSAEMVKDMEIKIKLLEADLEQQCRTKADLEASITQLQKTASSTPTSSDGNRRNKKMKTTTATTPTTSRSSKEVLSLGNDNENVTPTRGSSKTRVSHSSRLRSPGMVSPSGSPKSSVLSPIPTSKLNMPRFAPNKDEIDLEKPHHRVEVVVPPPRKRTAAEISDDGEKALSTTANAKPKEQSLSSRTRSSYGDRRRIRRNQPAASAAATTTAAAEQCAQQ